MGAHDAPFQVDKLGALTVPLHVLQMPNGRLPVPNRTTALFVEIGTNGEATTVCKPFYKSSANPRCP